MKKYTLIISLFVLACNSKEDQLKKQLAELEKQLTETQERSTQIRLNRNKLQDSIIKTDWPESQKISSSESFKNVVSDLMAVDYKLDSLKKAIADTKEKILLEK